MPATDELTRPERLARELNEALESRTVVAPLSDRYPDLGLEEAYQIQTLALDARIKRGQVVAGRKVGLTSLAMQLQLGVGEPDFGVLLDDMFIADGDGVELNSFIQPRVESEIAFVLGEDLTGPGIKTVDVLRSSAGVTPALEIIDSRIQDWRIKLVDTVADNASSAAVVLGGRLTHVADLDLRLLGVVFSRNGVVTETGAGAAVLGHPARCVAWLANKLAEFGEHLPAGTVVLAGSLHRAVPVGQGDTFLAEFDRIGSVSVRFVNG